MKLEDAKLYAHLGNFMTHENFDDSQSMHEYEGRLCYEDGAIVSGGDYNLEKEKWSAEGWRVKFPSSQIDREKLFLLHEEFKGYTLPSDRSYEECVIR